jgi:3-oxoadipate enol-lactonase
MYFRNKAGRRFQYDLLGPDHAPAVVCIHALGADHGLWTEQVPALLANGYCVLSPDVRGHGGSDAAAEPYTMDGMADDVADLIEALGLGRVHCVGTSMGGIIGQAFALRHPDKLVSLLISDTLSVAPPAGVLEPRAKAIRDANSVSPLVDATLERWFTDGFRTQRPRRLRQISETIAATSPAGFLGCISAFMNFDFRAGLPSIRTPTLVACGAEDTSTPPEINRQTAAMIAGARYHEIAGARHCPNVEFHAEYNSMLLDWLAAHAPKPMR